MISVVIPTYHRNASLQRCLEQLAPGVQTLPADQYEVIVSDDGSTSTAENLIRERFPWAKWTAGPGRGPAANRNHGVSASQGDWIAFTDDDCVPSPGWLAGYVGGITDPIELYEGETTCKAGLRRFADDSPVNLKGGDFPSCNLLVSRRLFDEIGGFDANFPRHAVMEDVDFRTRILEGNRPWRFIPAATIDHPPRLRVTGRKLGERWENTVYYWAKRPGPRAIGNSIPKHLLKVRISTMLKTYRFIDWPAATWSLIGEWWHVIWNVQKWERKYAHLSLPGGHDVSPPNQK